MATVPDPYGVDIALTADGQVVVGGSGAVGTIQGPENCVQALISRVRTALGELPLHPDYGSGFGQFVGKKKDLSLLRGEANVELERLVAQDRRFIDARDVEALDVDGQPESAHVKVKLFLAAGDTLHVSDLQGPRIDEVQPPDDADLADLIAVDSFEDFEFIAQDEAEQSDLRDQASVIDVLALTPDAD